MKELMVQTAERGRALAERLAREAWAIIQDYARRGIEMAKAQGSVALNRAIAWLEHSCTIVGKTFAERIVERALKIQIAFLVFLALVAPFGGFGLEPILSPLLMAQAGLTWLAQIRVRRRDPVLGAGLYMVLAAVTFIEAKGYSGMVGAIFAFEAMLSLIAAFYIVALLRVRAPKEDTLAELGEGSVAQASA